MLHLSFKFQKNLVNNFLVILLPTNQTDEKQNLPGRVNKGLYCVITDSYLLSAYSWSLLLFQQPVGRQDLHHHVRSDQHVLLSCHGKSCIELHVRLKGLCTELLAFWVCRISAVSTEDGTFTALNITEAIEKDLYL